MTNLYRVKIKEHGKTIHNVLGELGDVEAIMETLNFDNLDVQIRKLDDFERSTFSMLEILSSDYLGVHDFKEMTRLYVNIHDWKIDNAQLVKQIKNIKGYKNNEFLMKLLDRLSII